MHKLHNETRTVMKLILYVTILTAYHARCRRFKKEKWKKGNLFDYGILFNNIVDCVYHVKRLEQLENGETNEQIIAYIIPFCVSVYFCIVLLLGMCSFPFGVFGKNWVCVCFGGRYVVNLLLKIWKQERFLMIGTSPFILVETWYLYFVSANPFFSFLPTRNLFKAHFSPLSVLWRLSPIRTWELACLLSFLPKQKK